MPVLAGSAGSKVRDRTRMAMNPRGSRDSRFEGGGFGHWRASLARSRPGQTSRICGPSGEHLTDQFGA
jgi:hypothetical protein